MDQKEININNGRLFIAVRIFSIITIILAGCGAAKIDKSQALLGKRPMPQTTLGPGDVIEIKFFYVPELNDNYMVLPDGTINPQMVGNVKVYGKSPTEIQEELNRLYSAHLKKPDLTVIVRSLRDRRIYVGGEVQKPGAFEMPGDMTVLEAILLAGGHKRESAKLDSIVVVRERHGKPEGYVLNLEDVLDGKPFEPFFLAPHDVVFVPPTQIASINLWIDQYINKMVPQLGVIYSWPVGTGVMTIDTTTNRPVR